MQNLLFSWIGRLNIVKKKFYSKQFTVSEISINISMIFFTKIGENILKFSQKHKRSPVTKAILSKQNDAEGIIIHCRSIVIKTAWYWHKNAHVDQLNRIEDSNLTSQNYSHLIFDRDGKKTHWRKIIFNK